MKTAQGTRKKVTTKSSRIVKVEPVAALDNAFASSATPTRTLQSGRSITRLGLEHYANIRHGVSPFEHCNLSVNTSDAIYLCQKAYWNVPIFKQTIDIMAEFSNSEIVRWEGGNKASQNFFKALFEKIGYWKLQDQFYREYYRSGNIFMLRFDGLLSKAAALKISQLYPDDVATAGATDAISLPIRYLFLNPMDMQVGANVSFYDRPVYLKTLNSYELERLKLASLPNNSCSQQEKDLYESLSQEQKDAIAIGELIAIPIDPNQLHTVFYKKMDYEPMATPMGFCVLDDIDMKLELKKMDRVILRTVESTILLITMGNEPEKGGVNEEAIAAVKEIMRSETIGRILVADYTTKAEFVVADLNKVLGATKYEIVNEDIANGLNNIFWGEQKFANAMIKLKIFAERLEDGRDAFKETFLMPEVKRIAQMMGFKSYPTPVFRSINLDDDVQVSKMFTRLAEIGVLTANETMEAIRTGVLPDPEDSLDNQKEYFEQRQEGLYSPLLAPGTPTSYEQQQDEADQAQQNQLALKKVTTKTAAPGGRPAGSKAPQTTKKVGPIGTGTLSFSLLKDTIVAGNRLINEVETSLRDKHDIKRLSKKQKNAAFILAQSIMENETPEDWDMSIASYLDAPQEINHEAAEAIDKIAYDHQISRFVATLLYHSQNE